jgi:hypothetical protein
MGFDFLGKLGFDAALAEDVKKTAEQFHHLGRPDRSAGR